ncbi:MAG: D-alanyl-D-alanine carboxypeptidase/D-alanyl-D-alanine-endopeptidase [Phycisphaerales bacterium]|nr:D-alanyl-D-alanine carboxypeptidase/D-alanyl-D-alanine-endopeptidase [Phycisphaerales bacterium]
MRHLCAVVGLIGLLLGGASWSQAGLESDIRDILADKYLQKVEAGIEVIQLESGAADPHILYRHQSEIPYIPASNLKLATTSAALHKLGPDFKFRTLLVLHEGDLILVGDGDPALGDYELLRKSGWDVDTVFKNWAELLKGRGITSIRNVIVDDSVFDEVFIHPNWPADQINEHYMAEVGGVNLNANLLNFQVKITSVGQVVQYITNPPTHYATIRNICVSGRQNAIWFSRMPQSNEITLRGEASRSTDVPVSVTMHDPPMYAATVLSETIRNAGIAVTGTVQRDRTIRTTLAVLQGEQKNDWVLSAVHETGLSTVLARTNKDSMNMYAECLCKRLGFATRGEGTWANGTAAVGEFLKSLGIGESEFKLDDGCGLSKENRISANALTRVLAHNFQGDYWPVFLNSLAVAGVDGTLNDRFTGTDLRGRVFAKSGYVAGVSSLSGYLKTNDGRWYAFSILFNGIPRGTNSTAKVLQERIVRAIDATTATASR